MFYFSYHVAGETRRPAPAGGKLPEGSAGKVTVERDLNGTARSYRETGGTGKRPEYRTGILRDRRPERRPTADREECERSSDRTSCWLRPVAHPERSWVPGPAPNGIENPERVAASAKTPSGFLSFGWRADFSRRSPIRLHGVALRGLAGLPLCRSGVDRENRRRSARIGGRTDLVIVRPCLTRPNCSPRARRSSTRRSNTGSLSATRSLTRLSGWSSGSSWCHGSTSLEMSGSCGASLWPG